MKSPKFETLTLDKIVGGGQAMGTLADGRKAFVWGGLPGETVIIQITKAKAHMVEGIVTEVITAAPERIAPQDPETYVSTSPWQIMKFTAEQRHKSALINEAFALHKVDLPEQTHVFTDNREYGYRNKVEFSFYGYQDTEGGDEHLHLAFYRRGSQGKVVVEQFSLVSQAIMHLALQICAYLESLQIQARDLKTLLIRCDQQGNCVWQLYVKKPDFPYLTADTMATFEAQGGEIIYSDPKSPASRITNRLKKVGNPVLTDTILGVPFRYATEGFFQVNIPVYERALKDISSFIPSPYSTTIPGDHRVLDLYSGVGNIGLTIGGNAPQLVEINADAVREMRRNIAELGSQAEAILAPSEKALEYITSDKIIVVDPPRAGLHKDVVDRLLDTTPPRIIYLSCNPVTQARDVALLLQKYKIIHHQGYNFFPRTPHIEHLLVLDKA